MSERSEFSSFPDYNPGEREPAAGGAGQRGATFFCLLFLVVKKSKTPGRAEPADLLPDS